MLCTHGTAAVAATGPARSVSGGSHTPDPRHVQRFSTCTAIGHLPGSPDLHGTRGYVRWTDLGRPVAAAAAVPQLTNEMMQRCKDHMKQCPSITKLNIAQEKSIASPTFDNGTSITQQQKANKTYKNRQPRRRRHCITRLNTFNALGCDQHCAPADGAANESFV